MHTYNVSENVLRQRFRERGYEIENLASRTHRTYNENEIIDLHNNYSNCVSVDEFCIKHGVGVTQLLQEFNKRGLLINRDDINAIKRYTFNNHFFDIIDNEEKAYFLGLLFADGCNFEKNCTVSIQLQARDIDILEKFKLALLAEQPINARHTSPKSKIKFKSYRLDLSDQYFSKCLSKHGMVQNKSLILEWPLVEIPDNLLRHFVRGFIDGDGSLFITKSRPSKFGKRVGIQICGTLKFLTTMSANIKRVMSINGHIHKRGAIYELKIDRRNDVREIITWLYSDCSTYLDRKYSKHLEMLEFIKQQEAK